MAGVNNIVRSEARKSIFPSSMNLIDSSVSFAQGDLMVFDAVNKLIIKPTLEAEGVTFLGVAVETVVSGKLARPYSTDVDASAAVSDVPGPVYGVIAKLVAKTGDAFTPGCLVYLDPATGTRGVAVAGTKAIGIYQGKSIVAVAGQQIEVLVGARMGEDVLKF